MLTSVPQLLNTLTGQPPQDEGGGATSPLGEHRDCTVKETTRMTAPVIVYSLSICIPPFRFHSPLCQNHLAIW